MPKRIIYIPRPRLEAQKLDAGGPSLVTQGGKWKTHIEGKVGKGYTFYLKCQDESLPGDATDGEADSQIYIYGGHGLPGVDGAGWPGDPGKLTDQVVVTAAEIATRISNEGWSPALFKGKIKVYSCYSAASGSGGETPFAALVASAMRELHWENCSFFGYMTQVMQTYTKLMGPQATNLAEKLEVDVKVLSGFHKWSVSGSGTQKMTQGRARKVLGRFRAGVDRQVGRLFTRQQGDSLRHEETAACAESQSATGSPARASVAQGGKVLPGGRLGMAPGAATPPYCNQVRQLVLCHLFIFV